MINTKKDKDFIMVISAIALASSSIFAILIWDQLREFEKIAFIISLSGISLILLISLFINICKSPKAMTEEQMTAKKYKELADRYRELKKELKEVDLQMKIIERSVVQIHNNRPYMDKIK